MLYFHLTTPKNALFILRQGIKMNKPNFLHKKGIYLIGISERITKILYPNIFSYLAISLHTIRRKRYFVALKVNIKDEEARIYENYFKDNNFTNTYIVDRDINPDELEIYNTYKMKKIGFILSIIYLYFFSVNTRALMLLTDFSKPMGIKQYDELEKYDF